MKTEFCKIHKIDYTGGWCGGCVEVWEKKAKEKTKPSSREIRFKRYLVAISQVADGLKPEVIDYKNCFKTAKLMAKEALIEKCKTCGK